MELVFVSADSMQAFARQVGERLRGGEVLELIGDVGAGKTTFTKGLATGLAISDDVQSPSFTVSRTYTGRNGLELHHYDFYRLLEPGIMQYDIAESTDDPSVVTVVEWGQTVSYILPDQRSKLTFSCGSDDNERRLVVTSPCPALQEAYVAWS